jgi:predicted  nucleic acid-binding Zn-ribbon protein
LLPKVQETSRASLSSIEERDASGQKEEQMKKEFAKDCKYIMEVLMEVDTPLEEQVLKISEAIQGFRTKIVDLETRMKPSTPLEERDQREKIVSTTVESINTLEPECATWYKDSTEVQK